MTYREIILEREVSQNERLGCLMAMVDDSICKKLMAFNKQIIKDEDLYHKFNEKGEDEFGREKECHVTIRYGFTEDLNELEIRQLLSGQKEFMVEINGLDIFDTNSEFDVVKFNVSSPILSRLNQLTSIYPNKTDFPEYHPHLTLAYVKKGTFPHKKNIQLQIPINSVVYSPISGDKSSYDLNENNIETDVDARISKLEQEWERLDSMGQSRSRQKEIENELERLRSNKHIPSDEMPDEPPENYGTSEPSSIDLEKAREYFAKLRQGL